MLLCCVEYLYVLASSTTASKLQRQRRMVSPLRRHMTAWIAVIDIDGEKLDLGL